MTHDEESVFAVIDSWADRDPTRCCARCKTPYNCGNDLCPCHLKGTR